MLYTIFLSLASYSHYFIVHLNLLPFSLKLLWESKVVDHLFMKLPLFRITCLDAAFIYFSWVLSHSSLLYKPVLSNLLSYNKNFDYVADCVLISPPPYFFKTILFISKNLNFTLFTKNLAMIKCKILSISVYIGLQMYFHNILNSLIVKGCKESWI